MVPDTANFAPHPITQCCHLVHLTALYQSHCLFILLPALFLAA